jgi:glycosyltransferase involved in cell wall biosynthesis
MKILFIHQNFPGQWKNLAPELARRGHDVTALFPRRDVPSSWKKIDLKLYDIDRSNSKDSHPWVLDFETKVIRAEACFRKAEDLAKQGYVPDTIIAHPGWGESLFLKRVWPKAKLGIYCEFYYHPSGVDVGFDQEFAKDDLSELCRVQLKNANILLQAEHADGAISPTHWQASLFPKHLREKITVVHDGIDTEIVAPNPKAQFQLANGRVITKSDQVVTFVNRSLEPYRGFHIFMRSLQEILIAQPQVEILIVGDDGVSYGASPPSGTTWKKIFGEEVLPILSVEQKSRLHFLGRIPYDQYLALLQVSTVHVYLTYPFVLGWSLLEAMSVGCAIVASDTQPVNEAIENDVTGKLFNFFSHKELALNVIKLLDNSKERARLGLAARKFAREKYDLKNVCLPRQFRWAEELNNKSG